MSQQIHISANKAIRKTKRTSSKSTFGLDRSYPVDDIIIKCLHIQRLLNRSSRAIRRFSMEIKSLNHEMNQVFAPIGLPPIESAVGAIEDQQLIDHRQVFERILQYSDESETEEPEECNTSRCDFKVKRERKYKSQNKLSLHNDNTPTSELVLRTIA